MKAEEIQELSSNTLEERYNTCQKVKGIRAFHCFIPQSESLIKCQYTSSSSHSELHQVAKAVPLTLQNKDTIACIYDGQWCIAEVNNIDDRNQDVHVIFYHPPGLRTSF